MASPRLWTAYYLKRDQPDLRIAVLEKEFAGFGASGRNGGWLTAELPGQARRYAAAHGWGAAVGMQRQMFAAVDEVIDVAAKEGIEADIVKDGVLHVATNPAQERRLLARRPQLAHEGWGAADLAALDQEALDRRVRIPACPHRPVEPARGTHPPGPAGAGAGRRRRGHGRRHLRGHGGDRGWSRPGP